MLNKTPVYAYDGLESVRSTQFEKFASQTPLTRHLRSSTIESYANKPFMEFLCSASAVRRNNTASFAASVSASCRAKTRSRAASPMHVSVGCGAVEASSHGLDERLHVAGWHKPAMLARAYQLGNAGNVGANNRSP